MGQVNSKQFKASAKVKTTGGGKGGKGSTWRAIVDIPLNLESLLLAKTAEAGASAFERGALGTKHMGDLYSTFKYRNQPGNGAPDVQVSKSSIAAVFQGKDYIGLFTTFLQGVQVVAQDLNVGGESELKQIGIQIADEIGAQTGLKVPKTFASHVYMYAKSEAKRIYGDGLQHLYFLFHPDVNWHPEFRELVTKKPLPDNVVAMSESLDCLIVWMKFLRGFLDRMHPKTSKTTMFQLIIPAWETTVIKNPLQFPDVGLLTIQDETYRQLPLVWFNLPTVEDYPEGRLKFKYVGNMARPESEWKKAAEIAAGLGVSIATMGAVVAVSSICPPIILAWPFVGEYTTRTAVGAVEKRLGKEIPRVPGIDEVGNHATDDDDDMHVHYDAEEFIVQPETKHLGRRKHRHGHRQGHRRSRRS